MPADVDFERDFIDRLNVIYKKTNLEEQRTLEMIKVTSKTPNNQKITDSKFLFKFAKRIAVSGVKDLKNVDETIRKMIKAYPEESDHPMEIIKAHKDTMKLKYRVSAEDYMKHFDMQSVLLNLVDETTDELLAKKLLLLKHYMAYDRVTITAKWNRIMQIINFDLKEKKHQYLQELCYEREICKYYPGFTDFMADLIEDVIALPAETFRQLMLTLKQLVKERMNFFGTVIYEIDYNKFSVIMDHLQRGDVDGAKEVLRTVRDFIKNKFKLIKTTDATLKTKTKAIRMLMEIIDKVCEKDGSELLRITFGNLKSVLRHHVEGNTGIVDVTKVFQDFMKDSLMSCDSQWGSESREEVKVLVETALRGSSLMNPELLKDLFRFGSQFLQRAPVDLFLL